MSLDFWSMTSQQGFDQTYTPDRAVLVFPTETNCPENNCGWDPITQSGKNITCPVCHGTGKTTSLLNYHLYGRLMWTTGARLVYQPVSAAAEIGDCMFSTDYSNAQIVDLAFTNERAYLVADDKIVRPKVKQEQRVGALVKEYEYVCYLYNPE